VPLARWTLVIPVKPAELGKSRLGGGPALARAVALDTVSAAAAASRVCEVVLVTGDTAIAAALAGLGRIRVVREERAVGIAAAIRAGLAGVTGPRAALLGDLPALDPAELDAALALAETHDRAFVRDADGTGTTLVTAVDGVSFAAEFGPDSAARHAAAGLVELPIPADSTLRRDVDTPEQLAVLLAAGLLHGSATAEQA